MSANHRPRTTKWIGVIGLAVLIAMPAAGLALATAASSQGLFETSPTPVVVEQTTARESYSYEYVGEPSGLAYSPTSQAFVMGLSLGSALAISAGTHQVAEEAAVCPEWTGAVFSPGFGSSVYIDCGNATAQVLETVNASTLQVTGSIPLGTAFWEERFVEDPELQTGYLTGYDGGLRTVSLGDQKVLSNVSVPGGPADPLWFDTTTQRLLLGTWSAHLLEALDPATGSVVFTTEVSGNVTSIVGDPTLDRIYVGYTVPGTQDGSIEVFNASTLEPVSNVNTPLQTLAFSFVLAGQGEVGFSDYNRLFVLNAATDLPVGSSAYLSGSGLVAYDPTNDSIAEGGQTACYPDECLAFEKLSTNDSHAAPLSAIPLVGASTPTVLEGAGVLLGAALLATFGRRRLREMPPELGNEARGRDLATDELRSEAARVRWLERDPNRQHNPP